MYVRIYKEKESATQASPVGNQWILEVVQSFDNSFHQDITGWNATKDMQKQIKLRFNNRESAMRYANSHNMTVTNFDSDTATANQRKKNYLSNFET